MNNYHIYDQIGKGKHSVVYKGRRKKSIEYFAIKSVEKSEKPKVLQEVRTLHPLRHDNVLKFEQWYETTNHLWLILEYCVGGDLLTLLRQDTKLPEESIHDFARDLVKALQFLHSNGVVYCDLKPSNILLDENGRLKLCDFGLARHLKDIGKASGQQVHQARSGTPCYMAPELLDDGGIHSFGSDLWSLGCVMYECHEGRPPFVSSSLTQLVNSILTEDPPPLSGTFTQEFQDLVLGLLHKDPVQRIQWGELREHPFWRVKFKPLSLPPQPAFENYLEQKRATSERPPPDGPAMSQGNPDNHPVVRDVLVDVRRDRNAGNPFNGHGGIQGRQAASKVSSALLKDAPQKLNAGVNALRLSRIVRNNLQREADGDAYRIEAVMGTQDDVTLENPDLELDFAERQETGEDEDTSGAASEPQSHSDSVGSRSHSHSKSTSSSDADAEPSMGVMATPSKDIDGKGGGPTESTGSGGKSVGHPVSARPRVYQMEPPNSIAATPPNLGMPRKTQRNVTATGKGRVQEDLITGRLRAAELRPASGHGTRERDVQIEADSLAQVLWHASDLSVKPIMQNRRIEKIPEPSFEPRQLPVEPVTPTAFVELQPENSKILLSRLMGTLTSNASPGDKLNTLKYLEKLSKDPEAANVLIKSSLMGFLVKILRMTKSSAIRIQITLVMGLLIRHATVIQDELSNSGIVTVLTEGLRDEHSEKVRRRAMATLGELIFYIASQSKENVNRTSAWQVPPASIALISSTLRRGEDEMTQHYAVKTIENVVSEGTEWAAKFSNQEVVNNLCYIFKHTNSRQEHLRLTAGSCIVRLVRFSPTYLPLVLDRLGVREMVTSLAKGSSRDQQIHVSLLNLLLKASGPGLAKHEAALLEDKTLVPTVCAMLELSSEVLRGKALVFAALLCRTSHKLLLPFCNAKLILSVERLSKDKDIYVQQCLEVFVQTVISLMPDVLGEIDADLQQGPGSASKVRTAPGTSPGQGGRALQSSPPRAALGLLSVLLHLITSNLFRGLVVDAGMLKYLALYLERIEGASSQGNEEFQSMLLHVVEAISQNTSLLLDFQESILLHLLPRLASLCTVAASGDSRSTCFKIFCDLLGSFSDFLAHASEAVHEGVRASFAGRLSPGSKKRSTLSMESKQQQDTLVQECFLPMYPNLLQEEDPIPMYAQRLLLTLLDHQQVHVADVERLGLVPQMFEFLRRDYRSMNMHMVRLSLAIASAPQVASQILSDLGVVSSIGGLLKFVTETGMEDFVEPVLSLCLCFLERHLEVKEGEEFSHGAIGDITDLGMYSSVFLHAQNSRNSLIAVAAAECLMLVMDAAPRESAESVLQELGAAASILDAFESSHDPETASQLQHLLMQALVVALEDPQAPVGSTRAEISALDRTARRLAQVEDRKVAAAALGLLSELQQL